MRWWIPAIGHRESTWDFFSPRVEDGKGGRGWRAHCGARGSGLVGFFGLPSEEREEGWVPLGVMEERKDGGGFHRGAGGGETEENPRWKIEGGEAKESDRGFKPPGSILSKSVHWKGSRRLSLRRRED